MAAKKPKLTKEQKEKLLAMLEDDDDTEESQADEHTEPEANAGTNQVIVFTGSPDDFFKHFKAASPADADMAEKSDEATQESDGEQEDQAKDEPQPKSRSRYFRK